MKTNVQCFLVCLFLFASCQGDRREIEYALKKYDDAIVAQDLDAMAGCYAPDGKLGGQGWNFVESKDSIRKFLESFKGAQVLSNRSKTSSILIEGEAATQKGTYVQVAVLHGKDTIEVTGQFEVAWTKKDYHWLISRMYTSDYENRSLNKNP